MTRSTLAIISIAIVTIALALSQSGCNRAEPATNLSKPSDYPPLSSSVADAPFEMVDGTQSKISDRKGKVVLVNLWATWCGFCRQEMPHLVAMQNQHGDKGFQVVGLDVGGHNDSTPESIESINQFALTMNLNYELARVDPTLLGKFQKVSRSGAVPQSFLIDREGRLRGVFIGSSVGAIANMETIVANVVNE